MAFTDRIYLVDWDKLVTWLIPAPLRQPKMLALVKALVVGVADLYNRYTAYKDYTVYWLGINSQVCYMERALNDKYDIALRRIEIVDGIAFDGVPFWLKIENKIQKLYLKSEDIPIVLYTKEETEMFSSDFVVLVPMDIVFNVQEMRAFIDTFRTPAKTYIIKLVP